MAAAVLSRIQPSPLQTADPRPRRRQLAATRLGGDGLVSLLFLSHPGRTVRLFPLVGFPRPDVDPHRPKPAQKNSSPLSPLPSSSRLLVRRMVDILVDLQDKAAALLVAGLPGVGRLDGVLDRPLVVGGIGRVALVGLFAALAARRLDFDDCRRPGHSCRHSDRCRVLPARRCADRLGRPDPAGRRRLVLARDGSRPRPAGTRRFLGHGRVVFDGHVRLCGVASRSSPECRADDGCHSRGLCRTGWQPVQYI